MSKKNPPPATPVRNRSHTNKIAGRKSCQATTSKGQPCKSLAMNGSRYCFFHDPKKKTERKAAQRKGGKNALAQRRPAPLDLSDVSLTSAHDVLDLMSDTISKLRRRE